MGFTPFSYALSCLFFIAINHFHNKYDFFSNVLNMKERRNRLRPGKDGDISMSAHSPLNNNNVVNNTSYDPSEV